MITVTQALCVQPSFLVSKQVCVSWARETLRAAQLRKSYETSSVRHKWGFVWIILILSVLLDSMMVRSRDFKSRGQTFDLRWLIYSDIHMWSSTDFENYIRLTSLRCIKFIHVLKIVPFSNIIIFSWCKPNGRYREAEHKLKTF